MHVIQLCSSEFYKSYYRQTVLYSMFGILSPFKLHLSSLVHDSPLSILKSMIIVLVMNTKVSKNKIYND